MIHLITEQEVKNLTDIGDNVDESKFCHYIQIAQDKQIKNAIGEACYNNLLDGVENNDLTADESILLNGNNRQFVGLKTALAWWILWYTYPNLHSRVTNTGVQTQSGENFDPVSAETLEQRRKGALSQGEYYVDQMICFMRDNDDLYPCFDEDGSCCEDRMTTGYESSGIVLNNDSHFDFCHHCGLRHRHCKCSI